MDNGMDALSNETPTSVFTFDIKSILCLDDFEECSARASSGGSLYGVLRRQAFLRSPGGKPAPGPTHRPMQRQRSRSLIQRSVALPEDKSLLKMLCDYSEMTRRQQRLVQENRRHSEATLLCDTRLNKSPAVVRLSRSATPSKRFNPGTSSSLIASLPASPHLELPDPTPNLATDTTTTTSSSATTSTQSPSTSTASTTAILSLSDNLTTQTLTPPKTVYRRRSFARTQHGLVSGCDETVTLSTTAAMAMTSSSTSVRASSFPEKGISSFFIFGGDEDSSSEDRQFEENCCRRVLTPTGETTLHRVLILGGPGVGKTAITQQFLTSEYMAAQNTSFDDGVEITISVVVDGEESILELIDLPYNGELNTWQEYDVDGFIIVYSIIDRRSYQKAIDLLCRMRSDIYASSKKPIILVANKSDLERSRIISKQEGKTMADMYDSKYIDVSAILNHRVDDLLVGMLKQLRFPSGRRKVQQPAQQLKQQRSRDDSCLMGCLAKSKGTLIKTFVRQRLPRHSKSCESLLRI